MNLTKEYLDKALKNLATKDDLKKFTTKDDLNDRFEHQTAMLVSYIERAVESLATMVAEGFNELQSSLDVRERVQKLEKEIKQIKETTNV
jgi:hypothetical protein